MARLENTFKKYLVSIMGTRWDVQSHEDRYSEGVPDLSYGCRGVNGWIELKQIKAWPKLTTTLAKPDHYEPHQVNWLIKRGKKGGRCFVMVRVGKDEYFLFTWLMARDIAKGLTRHEYEILSVARWKKSIDPVELLTQLTREVYHKPLENSYDASTYDTPFGEP